MLTAAVSGSFHRHLHAIARAVEELYENGVRVLSPADPRIVDSLEEFLFVASDRVRSVRLVQDRHLEAIRAADFLWLVSPDGYVGQSASMEIGFAVGNGVFTFGVHEPCDLTLRQYVRRVSNLKEAIRYATANRREKPESFLIDPHASIEAAHGMLDRIRRALDKPAHSDSAAAEVYSARDELSRRLIVPPVSVIPRI